MYKKHFGLTDKPFSLTPDPDYLFLTKKHTAAYCMLEYGLFEQDGMTVITGEVGAGKTTLLRYLLNNVDDSLFTVGLINNTHKTLGSLLEWIALALDIEYQEEWSRMHLFRTIQECLISEYAQGRMTVLVVDEAQNLDKDALEELRLITNINADKDQLVKIILVGQPQLLEMLDDPDLSQVAQRISAEYHLDSLDCQDTMDYIRARLKSAGSEEAIFSEKALVAVYYFSGGVPRIINKICDYALLFAYAEGGREVKLDTITEVVKMHRLSRLRRGQKPVKGGEAIREKIKNLSGVDLEEAVTA